jgi:DNA invertase Pin-like site-specific DNA recombinase
MARHLRGETAAQSLRAYTYERVSKNPRKRRGQSVEDQRAENELTCAERGWTIVGSFQDPDNSASRHARKPRPDFEAMVAGIRRGEADVIVYWEASRAYRRLDVFVELRNLCEETGALLCYNDQVYDMRITSDRQHAAQDAVQAETEADKIRDRNLRTTRRSAAKGHPHGRLPYGYRREYDPDTGDLLEQVIREDQAEIIREAAKRVVAGKALTFIAKDLQGRGVPTPSGDGQWTNITLKRLLLNETYLGRRIHQGRVVGPAQWPAILDEATFDKCWQKLTDPARRTQHDVTAKWLVSGIALSGCGTPARVWRNRVGVMCYTCPVNWCSTIPAEKFDLIVAANLLAYVERPEFLDSLVPTPGAEAVAVQARMEIAEIEAELEDARDRASKRRLSVASLSALEMGLLPRIDEARSRLRRLGVPQVVQRVAGPSAREVWEEFDLVQRREVLRAVTSLVQFHPVRRGARGITPDRFSIRFKGDG